MSKSVPPTHDIMHPREFSTDIASREHSEGMGEGDGVKRV